MLSLFDSIEAVLGCFILAFGLSYIGMRMLWTGIAASGTLRGFVMAGPIVALAVVFAIIGQPGSAVAVCLASAVLMTTLGTGVAAAGRGEDINYESATPTVLRLIPPLAAIACVAGFNGRLTFIHLIMLAAVGAVTIWSAVPAISAEGRWASNKLAVGVVLLAMAVGLIAIGSVAFQNLAGAMVVTPLVVLLAAPALLLPLMGLLSTESAHSQFARSGDTVGGFVIAALGAGLPVAVGIGLARSLLVQHFAPDWPKHATMMPVAVWRIDSLLLLVITLLLAPVATGKLRIGKLEGVFLIAVYLAYAAVASRTGLAG